MLLKFSKGFPVQTTFERSSKGFPVQTTFKRFEKEVTKTGKYFKDTSEKTYRLAGARVVKTRKANVTTIGFTHYVLQEYGKQDQKQT